MLYADLIRSVAIAIALPARWLRVHKAKWLHDRGDLVYAWGRHARIA
ncbi:hypothetical protein [Pseudanabaena sp. PCC 6802]|nr:hypothetical protein [Pseudanabaena sp. PCC 6802]